MSHPEHTMITQLISWVLHLLFTYIIYTDNFDVFVLGANSEYQLGLGHSITVENPTLHPFYSGKRIVSGALDYHGSAYISGIM